MAAISPKTSILIVDNRPDITDFWKQAISRTPNIDKGVEIELIVFENCDGVYSAFQTFPNIGMVAWGSTEDTVWEDGDGSIPWVKRLYPKIPMLAYDEDAWRRDQQYDAGCHYSLSQYDNCGDELVDQLVGFLDDAFAQREERTTPINIIIVTSDESFSQLWHERMESSPHVTDRFNTWPINYLDGVVQAFADLDPHDIGLVVWNDLTDEDVCAGEEIPGTVEWIKRHYGEFNFFMIAASRDYQTRERQIEAGCHVDLGAYGEWREDYFPKETIDECLRQVFREGNDEGPGFNEISD